MSKVISLFSDKIVFDDGHVLFSDHETDCCEDHYLYLKDLTLEDFNDLEFDLSGDSFFERVPGYGIRLIPINGHPVAIPGYGKNNGNYSDKLDLVVMKGKVQRFYSITSCQTYELPFAMQVFEKLMKG